MAAKLSHNIKIAKAFLINSVLTGSFLMAGCAGVGIIATKDPYRKLADAEYLASEANRPLPAERLIREAIDIFKDKNDTDGLAHAYLKYGVFFRSPSIKNWEYVYKRDGFLDKSANLGNRFEKSIEYLNKASAIFEEEKKPDMLTNVALNKANSYFWSGDLIKACANYEEARRFYKENITTNPDAKVNIPPDVKSLDEYIDQIKTNIKCPK